MPPRRTIGLAAAAAVLLWPAPAAAQDITGLILIVIPAALLAPFAALGIKWGIMALARMPPSRRGLWPLLGLALLEFLLWEIAYPAWAMFDMRIYPWWRLVAWPGGALLILWLLAWANFGLLRRVMGPAASPSNWIRALAVLFALLVPICLVLLTIAIFSGTDFIHSLMIGR